ncbi:GNAT family N-acetyltransferase [Ketobacter alkanivorans]|uniref:N-acetyltransferase domain-containing protein n=1 Tax=Ketobacter alkanivorans TaxID=1917421 RepID=A0A2K9LNP3_9GAMM|nr:GNAT family N-acetyltransferase [Ketobacter alkanivorans]AUM13095.1 hypothetical protein Kalk_11955 [Ketobacter alkanivorans]
MNNMHNLSNIVSADISDAEQICQLLNSAYRSHGGWTSEADLVAGNRSSVDAIRASFTSPDSVYFVLKDGHRLLGCINIELHGHTAHIGSFAVAPDTQGLGVGSKLLQHAECYSQSYYKVDAFILSVLTARKELISYYQRRGYAENGLTHPYPIHLNVGTPIVEGIELVELHKPVSRNMPLPKPLPQED